MPDILTHLIGADEALKNINDDIKAILLANRNVYNLGAQGPDLFFYYKPLPWMDSGNMGDKGTLIHTEKINQFFINAANRIKHVITTDPIGFFKSKSKNSAVHKEFSYLSGFLSHYAFDTICHPYIFFFSGIDGGYNHKYFECVIDTLLSDIYDGKGIGLKNTGRAVDLNKKERAIISIFMSKIIDQTFNVKVNAEDISRCFSDMSATCQSLYDPYYLKRPFLSIVDKVSKSKGRIMTASFPARMEKDIDYLNIKKDTWFNPCDDNLVYDDSFLELFEKSVYYSEDLIKALSFYLINTSSENQFKEIIGDKQYDTGLPGQLEMKHERIILDFKKTYDVK